MIGTIRELDYSRIHSAKRNVPLEPRLKLQTYQPSVDGFLFQFPGHRERDARESDSPGDLLQDSFVLGECSFVPARENTNLSTYG